MQVILLEDIKGTGKKGDLLNVSDGHARNYLLPRGLALEATKSNVNQLKLQQKASENKKQQELEAALELKAEIEKKTVSINVKIGENGKLFGSVTNKEIGTALEKQHSLKIDKKKITLADPIKNAGETSVDIKLHPKVTAKLKVKITEQ